MIPTDNVNPTNIDAALQSLVKAGIDFGLRMLVAIVILSVGMWLAGRFTRHIRRVMASRNLEPSLQSFLGSFVSILTKVLVVIITLTTVGVQMTSIVAVLGAVSLAIGMALQGTVQNFAGGVVILLFKPFKVGDAIETASGKVGIVKKIMIFTTELHTFDNQVVFLPNGELANGIITNLSNGKTRRTDLSVGISYGDSVDVARRVIFDVLTADKRILRDPPAAVFIDSLGDSAVILTVRFWTTFDDKYAATAAVLEEIYKKLPKKKVNFPFPQMDVHIKK